MLLGVKMIKILLLSAPIGSGHVMTATALKQVLETKENIEILEGNIFDFLPAWVGKAFLGVYLRILQLCPWLYGMAYSSGNGAQGNFLWLRNLFNRYMLQRGQNFLDNFKPDIVIATHATPLGIMSIYKQKHPKVKLYAVIPDYNIHHWWICDGVDKYFIADKDLSNRLPANAIVEALGLPLRKEFNEGDRASCRSGFGYKDEEKVLLLLGGGDGLLPMEKMVQYLLENKLANLRIVVVAGRNRQLVEQLLRHYANVPGLDIYGFRDDIPQLMLAADMIITKGGAVTAAEVLACNLKYIIYKPLPGQEEGNALFLSQKYGVMVAKSFEDIVSYIANPQSLQPTNGLSIEARKYAARKICDKILQ